MSNREKQNPLKLQMTAPVYRELELLFNEVLLMTERAPKRGGVARLCDRLVDAMLEAMTVTGLAIACEVSRAKLDLIEAVFMHTRTVKTCLDVLSSWSGKGAVRLLAPGQMARMAEHLEQIAIQLSAWKGKTAAVISTHEVSSQPA
jgi:hypothetical protein